MAGNGDSVWRRFSGLNSAYLHEEYERYRNDASAVEPGLRALFEQWGAPPEVQPAGNGAAPSPVAERERQPAAPQVSIATVVGAVALAGAIRAHGHRAAQLDPLGSEPPGDSALQLQSHGLTREDLLALPPSVVGGPLAGRCNDALEAIELLRETYQGTTGYEFDHVHNEEERRWLRMVVEGHHFRPPRVPIDELALLRRLTEVGAFERFLHTAFAGKTRFSLEGLGMLVPVLDEIIGAAAEEGTRCVFLGMAHRGRLNVLVHTLGKPVDEIISEFLGYYNRGAAAPGSGADEGAGGDLYKGATGDVKYHLGARKAHSGGVEVNMQVVLAPNPSHLEFVNPVVMGMDRAMDERRNQGGAAEQSELYSMSVLIHGDASFPGQGIVAESLNLSRVPGYHIGGAIHIIANNQIGFTTPPSRGRSTLYASDLAKGFEIPVIHVNADDPEACIAAARVAHAYRKRFRKDVLIDLIGYRRWGHNEGDDPTYTQPLMAAKIQQHPTVRARWAAELVRRGLITEEQVREDMSAAIQRLHELRNRLAQNPPTASEEHFAAGQDAGGEAGGNGDPGPAELLDTSVPLERLAELNDALYTPPDGFVLHRRLAELFPRRRQMFARGGEDGTSPPRLEWGHAEALAFASILADATAIRLAGQDVGRGTFSHRHAIVYDARDGEPYIPLQKLPQASASFEVWDSPLSEQATLAFEFGYSVQAQNALVIWEAQYGDFVNVPQAVIDQFIVSARSKWNQRSGLVMLLPHGYEGQGPEHSSARVERFLQLAAEDNMRVANCTTAAQYFHILRRQVQLLVHDARPLILLAPKSLLRNPMASSTPLELARGRFRPLLEDPVAMAAPQEVRRLVLCSGKVYYDLAAAWEKKGGQPPRLAVVRLEELYPLPVRHLENVLRAFPNLTEVMWVQEEPRNMGPWPFVAPRLRDILKREHPGVSLEYIGRTRRASPAEGSLEWHKSEQARLVEAALRLDLPEGLVL